MRAVLCVSEKSACTEHAQHLKTFACTNLSVLLFSGAICSRAHVQYLATDSQCQKLPEVDVEAGAVLPPCHVVCGT